MQQVTHLEYNLDNTLKKLTYSNTVRPTPGVAYAYDPNYNRVTSVSSLDASGAVAETVTYRYNDDVLERRRGDQGKTYHRP